MSSSRLGSDRTAPASFGTRTPGPAPPPSVHTPATTGPSRCGSCPGIQLRPYREENPRAIHTIDIPRSTARRRDVGDRLVDHISRGVDGETDDTLREERRCHEHTPLISRSLSQSTVQPARSLTAWTTAMGRVISRRRVGLVSPRAQVGFPQVRLDGTRHGSRLRNRVHHGTRFGCRTRLQDAAHHVIVDARNVSRARDIASVADEAAEIVIGDLADLAETRTKAEQV